MRITAADGITYASAADRLLGNPEKTTRNGNIRAYRRNGYREDAIRAYWQAFDAVATPCPPPSPLFAQCHDAGLEAAKATGGFAPPRVRQWEAERRKREASAECATRFAERYPGAPLPPRSSTS